MRNRTWFERLWAALVAVAVALTPALALAQGAGSGGGGGTTGGPAGGGPAGGGDSGGGGFGWIILILAIAAIVYFVTRRRRGAPGHR
ncbi:hypothetical protein [Anaeromyxobacter oryzae]|uniref:Uncharacterized protein n=1 Tax=Anaeromyxobacter oryzae TaxID=2918170 RepID=A0ABM7X098_9BACT|nr:hypothetical protein [Anaeromyxobacter oryzae]BDG05223.1 hypothetical protein AMOR_42190 [Anaeromyxobacter oryzae]